MARAQTNYDFLIGASIMLLTVLFVLINMPAIFDLGGASTDGLQRTQADRAAEHLITTHATNGSLNELRFDEPGGINGTLSSTAKFETFKENAGLATSTDRRTDPNVNVSLFSSDDVGETDPTPIENSSGVSMTKGDTYIPETSAATVSRIVTLANTDKCSSTCRLVVRVW
jgi:hypothetical protein